MLPKQEDNDPPPRGEAQNSHRTKSDLSNNSRLSTISCGSFILQPLYIDSADLINSFFPSV